jgi:hypothetical protein
MDRMSYVMDVFAAVGFVCFALGLVQIALRDLSPQPNRPQLPAAPLSELSTGV